jgi:uncharacterized protein YqjF (DUF2071 family)
MTAETRPAIDDEKPFLTARWRDLVMITWAMDPIILRPLVPEGTELDLWEGQALASVVAFDFADTRVMGMSIPFHRRFPEVNLRFYIRRRLADGSVRRGVAFVQEMVPRVAIAWTARFLYGEPYVARAMRHVAIPPEPVGDIAAQPRSLVYEWKREGEWERVIALVPSSHRPTREGTLEQFIVDHRWGYTRRPGKPTLEYRVEHPPWRLALDAECLFEADLATIYGKRFAQPLDRAPVSTFVADGSEVAVFRGRPIER